MYNETYLLFFQTISNRNRLAILTCLYKNGTLNVSQLTEILGLEQSIVSHHLKCLKNCGFVNKIRAGKKIFYSLSKKTINKLFELVDQHMREHCEHLGHCSILKSEGVNKRRK